MKKSFLVCLILSLLSLIFIIKRPSVVNIAYMSDSKYLPYVMVSLESAITNKDKNTRYNIHLIASDFTKNDSETIKKMEQENVKINIYPTKEQGLELSHLGRFASFKIALQKIFIADYLQKLDKVLYLDADTIVQTDLSKIYNTNIKEYYAGAVKDGLMYQFPEHIAELNLKNKDFYFNSGVMLLNLKKIRTEDILKKAIIYFNTHQDVFGDQDVLNVVFSPKVLPISYRYNCNSVFFNEKPADFLSTFWNEPVANNKAEIYKNAAILHFAGHKPWTNWFKEENLKALWEKYAKKTSLKYHISY